MSSTYSTNLELELPGTGDQAGAWGITANRDMGTLIEQAIAGYVVQQFDTDSDVTLDILSGADGGGNVTPGIIYSPGTAADPVSGRNAFIECTGTITANKNLIVPTNKKVYYIYNNTTGGYSIVVKTSAGTGVTVANGNKVIVLCNGTNVVDAVSYITTTSGGPGAFTTLSASSTVSGVGFSDYFAVPPPLGSTSPNTAAFTTLTTSSTVTLNPPNANVTISPTGTGTVAISPASTVAINPTGALTVNPTAASTINNTSIGVTTSATGKFTKAYTASSNIGTITTSLAPDCSTSNVFYCTATSATAFTCAPTNPSDGQTINIFITQPASGTVATWTATWAKWPGGSANGVLSTTLGAIDLVVATYRNSVWYATLAKAFS